MLRALIITSNLRLWTNLTHSSKFTSIHVALNTRLWRQSHRSLSSLNRNRRVVDMYNQLAEIPVPISAQFLTIHDHSGPTIVQLGYSVRDHERNIKRAVSKSVIFSLPDSSSTEEQFRSTLAQTKLQDETEITLQAVSRSKKKKVVLRTVKGNGRKDSRFVELWSDTRLEASLDVTDSHGDFYADEFVSSLSFSPSEDAILYSAEAKTPPTDPTDKFAKYRYIPDFGEGLSGKKRPALYLAQWNPSTSKSKVESRLYRIITPGYEHIRFGQAIFDTKPRTSGSPAIYATGYETSENDRMLGIKGCLNRPAGIWRFHVPDPSSVEDEGQADDSTNTKEKTLDATSIQKLTPPHLSCRSPRIVDVSSQERLLVWLSCSTGGAHAATNSLHIINIAASDAEDLLNESIRRAGDNQLLWLPPDERFDDLSNFPGLYPAQNLPSSPSVTLQAKNGTSLPFIITHSIWGSRTTILAISPGYGTVRDLTPLSEGGPFYSWSVLGTNSKDEVIVVRSTPSIPYEILLGKISSPDDLEQIGIDDLEQIGIDDLVVKWHTLDKPELPDEVSAALSTINTRVLPIEGRGLVETVLIQSSKFDRPPCITAPHGGPHGTSTTAFTASITALVLEGYTFSLPNYTGSLGFGEAFVQGLIGKCGELDVEEVIASAKFLVKEGISTEGKGRQFIYGGSHGGFLGAHLIAKYPQFFSGAILRNPVISVGELSTTDIPDWYFAEFGLPYAFASSPRPFDVQESKSEPNYQITPEHYTKLYAASPIAHVGSVKASVLLLIGKEDRRVAPSHGIALYHALKARKIAGVDNGGVEMLIHDGDSHPLESVEAGKVGFEASRDFLAKLSGKD